MSIIQYEDMENYVSPVPRMIQGGPEPAVQRTDIIYELTLPPKVEPKISGIAEVWDAQCHNCSGGQPLSCCNGEKQYRNNCAHYLSDALIRAGFRELLTESYLYKCDKRDCKAPLNRRPIRAREMWRWFQEKAKKKHEKIQWDDIPKNSGWWAVFQLLEREYWGGHVIILDTDNWEYYGTCSYTDWNQYLYQW